MPAQGLLGPGMGQEVYGDLEGGVARDWAERLPGPSPPKGEAHPGSGAGQGVGQQWDLGWGPERQSGFLLTATATSPAHS